MPQNESAIKSISQNLPTYQPGRPIEEVARELGLPADPSSRSRRTKIRSGRRRWRWRRCKKRLPGVNLYPDGNAFYLKQKLAAKLGVEPANLILGNGSNEIIEFVGHALLAPGADVVVSQYCFAIYPIVTKMFGADVITVPAKNYGHDLPAMLKAITPRTRIVFVANPNNPTGTLAPREELIRFINEVPDDVLLVMDEAYIEFLDDPVDLIPLDPPGRPAEPDTDADVLKDLRTGRPAHRLRHRPTPEFVAALEKIRQPFNANLLAQTAALAALDDARTHPQNAAEQFRRTGILRAGVRRLETGISYPPPPISSWSASARARKFSRRCSSSASSCGRWAAINCRNGSASPSARRRKTSGAWRR